MTVDAEGLLSRLDTWIALDDTRRTRLAAFVETLAFYDQDMAFALRNLLADVALGPKPADEDLSFSPSALLDLLRLTGDPEAYGVTREEIVKHWSKTERDEVEKWAQSVCKSTAKVWDGGPEVPRRIRNRYCEFVSRMLEGAPKDE